MKNKRPFYKNGIVIGALMFIVALIITKANFSAGAILGVSGMVVFFFSLIRALVRKIIGKKNIQPTLEVEQSSESTMPIQTPEILETPTPKQDPVEAIPAPPVPEVEQLQPEAVCVELPKAAELEKQVPDSPGNDNLVVEDDVYEPTESSVILRKLSIDEFVQEADKTGFVAFDFETTGFSAEKDRITEIGAIKLDANLNEIDRFISLVNPEMHLPSRVAAITGLSDDLLRTAPTIDMVLPEFLRFIDGYPLMAWNVSFDKSFLEKSACRCGLSCDVEYADALVWARQIYELSSYKQDIVAEHINYVPSTVHRAAADCETLVAIIKDMASRQQPLQSRDYSAHNINYDPSQRDDEVDANAYELAIANHFIAVIKEQKPDANPVLERRAQAYLSLCEGYNDFLRIKYTDRARWISIEAYSAGIERDNPLFAAQKNKNQRHWKAKLNDITDIDKFDDYVVKACH